MNGLVSGRDGRQDDPTEEKAAKDPVHPSIYENDTKLSAQTNGIRHAGGVSNGLHRGDKVDGGMKSTTIMQSDLPPEIQHITQGMIPFSTLVSRQAQECWIGFNDLVGELGDLPIDNTTSVPNGIHGGPVQPGKSDGGQSAANLQKKEKILKWAGDQRAFFIKLLVLSGWSRNAQDIHKAIDILNWLREQKSLYDFACDRMGYMRRDLAFAQIPNPDLETAAEVLSTGRLSSFPHLGYIKSKSLSPRQVLKTLRHLNQLLCTRLALHDQVPSGVQQYRVHDGRVTLVVPSEFELDLSIAEDNPESQFYFVALRFLFSPSSNIPDGRFLNETMGKVNDILRTDGLQGSYDFLHGLTLSYKVNLLFKQALEMTRGQWSDHLRVELIHRTLVVHYWRNRAAGKSWIEIGIKSGRRKPHSKRSLGPGVPFLDVRWIRDGKETSSHEINLDESSLSLENVLRSVIALHSSHLLETVYDKLLERSLYREGSLFLEVSSSASDPSECYLTMQITQARSLTINCEPITGALVLQPPSQGLMRHEMELNRSRNPLEEAPNRLCVLRCLMADHDTSVMAANAGWEPLPTLKPLQADLKRLFSSDISRYSFFRLPVWDTHWMLALTHSMTEDKWWLVESSGGPLKAQMLECQPIHFGASLSYAYFSALSEYVSTIIAQKANSRVLDDLQVKHTCEGVTQFTGSAQPVAIRFEVPLSTMQSQQRSSSSKSSHKAVLRISGLDLASGRVQFQARIHCPMPDEARQLLATHGAASLRSSFSNGICTLNYVSPVTGPVVHRLVDDLHSIKRLIAYTNILASNPTITLGFLSLSCFAIIYHQDPHARLLIRFPSIAPSDDGLAPQLTLSLNAGNPQERIKRHLYLILTNPVHSPGSNLLTVLRTLQVTFPLLSVFADLQNDRLPSPSRPTTSARFHILIVSATHYTLRFVAPSPSLDLTVSLLHKGRKDHWVVRISKKAVSPPPPATGQATTSNASSDPRELKGRLREVVFSAVQQDPDDGNVTANTAGDEWQRLDQGAAVEVGNRRGIEMLFKRIVDVVGEFSGQKGGHEVVKQGKDDKIKGDSSGEKSNSINKKTEGSKEKRKEVITLD